MSKVKVDFSEGFGRIKELATKGARVAADALQEEIIREISEGRSPVAKTPRRLVKYSNSYRNAIDKGRYTKFNKRKRPVNLKLSGKLHESIFAKPIGKTRIRLGFNNFLADIHNRQGAGRSKTVRRMLPTNPGENFTNNILIAVGIKLRRLANQILR